VIPGLGVKRAPEPTRAVSIGKPSNDVVVADLLLRAVELERLNRTGDHKRPERHAQSLVRFSLDASQVLGSEECYGQAHEGWPSSSSARAVLTLTS